jgi:hypothetical protein
MDIYGYFDEWKDLVRLLVPHLIENQNAFDDYTTSIELIQEMVGHKNH